MAKRSCSKANTESITKKSSIHTPPSAPKYSPKIEIAGKKSPVLELGEVVEVSNQIQDLVLSKTQQKYLDNYKEPMTRLPPKEKVISAYEITAKSFAKTNGVSR